MRPMPGMSCVLISRRLPALLALALLVAVSLVSLQLSLSAEARAAVRRPTGSPDWKHIYQVIANLNHRLPKVPVVYLVGGSAARECTISDSSWAAEVRRIGGPRLRTVELGSNGQNYYQDIDIVHRLPSVPSIVLIGIGLGRYVPQPMRPATRGVEQSTAGPGERPGARTSSSSYQQHHYSVRHILSDPKKRQFVRWWLADRYPAFKLNFAGNTAQLELLIQACQVRGLHPVLLEMPLNLPIVGRTLDRPRKMYTDSCRALAKKYGIPKIDFLKKVHLVSGDFFDMSHLVEPGRVKWQLRLSKTVVSLLKRYGIPAP